MLQHISLTFLALYEKQWHDNTNWENMPPSRSNTLKPVYDTDSILQVFVLTLLLSGVHVRDHENHSADSSPLQSKDNG